jgi:EF hand
MKHLVLVGAVAAVMALGGAALADHHGSKGMMRGADANSDGVVTRAEADSEMRNNFAEMDSDKNGSLSFEEFSARGKDMFGKADANNDGQITRDERMAMREKMKEQWRDAPKKP